jgi:hypothetical protein
VKKQLTTEQLENRAKINTKIFKFGCLPITVFLITVFVICSVFENTDETSKTANVNMDSLVSIVSKSTDFEIKEVYYDKKDSSFNIAITNKDNAIKEGAYSTRYFNNNFGLDNITEIEGVYLYEFTEGKSFLNKDYKNPLTFTSSKQQKIINKFDAEYYSSYSKSYTPLKYYLENTLNDPSSLEFVSSEKTGYTDGVFSIEGIFRAKNDYGALIINKVKCNINIKGELTNVQMN